MARIVSPYARLCIPESAEPPAWQALLRRSVTDPEELCRVLDLPPQVAEQARAAADGYALRVPRPWLERIGRSDPADPLLAQVLPRPAETRPAPGYSEDPLGERHLYCAPGLLWKYAGRCLMVASPTCAVHCRFCFRRHVRLDEPVGEGLSRSPGEPSVGRPGAGPEDRPEGERPPAWWDAPLKRIQQEDTLREVILSGGDPLCLPDRVLGWLVERLASIDHVRRLRIHTRLPVAIPQRVTDGLLAVLTRTRLTTLVVLHANHPQELDEQVAAAVGRLVDAGLPVLSQGVLLSGVNDRLEVLASLYERLIDLRVLPYYLHQLDPVAGAAHFQVSAAAGRRLIAELRRRLPGYAVPRYVRDAATGACKEVLA